MSEEKQPDDKNDIDHATTTMIADEKKLLRKIQLCTIPFICLVFFIEYIDKISFGLSGVLGILEGTHITHDQFGQLGTMFYVGFLVFQIPNSYLLQRLPTSKYLGTVITLWGVTLGCMALARNYAQLAAMRFILGALESVSYPALYLVITTMYRRSEQVTFFGLGYVSGCIAAPVGGLVAFGSGQLYASHLSNIPGWKWNMIILGSVTVVLGVCIFTFLPDKPTSRWLRLQPHEYPIVAARTHDNGVVANRKLQWSHVIESIQEPRFYCYLAAVTLGNVQNGCLQIFASMLIKELGFTGLDATLLQIPLGVFNGILVVVLSKVSRRTGEIHYVGILGTTISLIGAIILCALPNGPVKLLGVYLGPNVFINVFSQASISSNIKGSTKKILYTSINIIGYGLGHLLGPLMMVESQQPRYILPLIGYIIADIISIALVWYLRWSFKQENRKRETMQGAWTPSSSDNEEQDLTDKQDLYFRYKL
ncbi:hypothetical protein O0I10_009677 [Lichtheimia ornata]|uniref:Major facilitator superfamily (MFS) profile domain-containing protein n=1 Tax=Lichtheimia ornata TaxID=688661 RepID=A0AAD7UYX2_9FUNG|nr:uncharacterized protein O0I10_009677 [Lichtheimia ornata]KAJ8654626.1 hypothetical protein O0I10_009677 [Lichtheimia ornata]